MFKLKNNKKGIEMIEIVITMAILGLSAIAVIRGLSASMKKSGQTVINETTLLQPINSP